MNSTDATLSADFFIEEEEEMNACTQPCEMCPEVNCPKRMVRWSSGK